MTGHRQPWYLDRLRAELERVAAIEDRRERGPALGRLRPALGRLRPSPQTLVALAVVAALVAVVVTVARESDVERPAAPPGKKVVATDVERGVRFSLDGRVLTVQLIPPVRNQTFETVSGARISATCGTRRRGSAARDHAHPALAGRPDEPELPLPARRLDLVPALRPVRQPRRVRELPRRVVGGEGADRRDRQQVGAAVRLQPSDLHRLHEPDRLRAGDVPTGRGEADPGLQAVRPGVGSVLPRRDGPGNRHQRRPSGRHAFERRDRPAATYRDGRVADRQDGPDRGRGFRCRRSASKRGGP